MARAYVSLGSNLDPNYHLNQAIQLFKKYFSEVNVSSFYQSDGSRPFWPLRL